MSDENRVHIEPAGLGAEERQTSAEGSGAQSGDDFRRVISESADDIEDLNYVATNVLYARGSLPRDVRRAAVKAIRSYQVILSVARDPEGVLGHRDAADASRSDVTASEGEVSPGKNS